ncbi:hypothetical protein GCM10025794_35110 [Massilia kyonggiensis]
MTQSFEQGGVSALAVKLIPPESSSTRLSTPDYRARMSPNGATSML